MPRTCDCPSLPFPLLRSPEGRSHDAFTAPSIRPRSASSNSGSSKKGKAPACPGSCKEVIPHTPGKHSISGSSSEGPTTSPVSGLHFMCFNIRGHQPSKWDKIRSLPSFPKLDIIVLTEHHLQANSRPREIVQSGWDIHLVSGPQKSGSHAHCHRGGVALLTRISAKVSVKQVVVADPASGFMHQAAPWTLSSPTLACPIHVTGVYQFHCRPYGKNFQPLVSAARIPAG